MSEVRNLAVLGAGSWGATLSWLLASSGKQVILWTREAKKAERLTGQRRIDRPLEIIIPDTVKITSNLRECIEEADALILACTSQTIRQLAERIEQSPVALDNKRKLILVGAVKGLELTTLKRMSQVLAEIMPDTPICALSGPNLAAEILKGHPAAAVVASDSLQAAETVQKALSTPKFRVYVNDDIVGVELGGTLKNVIAIAAGVSDGLELGINAKAALLTRGLAEMTRLSVALGAKAQTLTGLAGMGDLFATSSGPQSRNYRLGFKLAQGQQIEQVLDEVGAVIEGVATTAAVCELSKRLELELPIAQQVNDILKRKTTPKGAIMNLMARPLSSE